jgi:hypothetical protein
VVTCDPQGRGRSGNEGGRAIAPPHPAMAQRSDTCCGGYPTRRTPPLQAGGLFVVLSRKGAAILSTINARSE